MAIDRFLVDESHIMMFARSVGDPNPIYQDPEYAGTTEVGHIIAPPTFAQSSAQFDDEYFLRPKPGQAWFGSGGEPSGIKREKKEGKRGGKLIFSETITEYYDADDQLVVTATGVGVRTEKVIEG